MILGQTSFIHPSSSSCSRTQHVSVDGLRIVKAKAKGPVKILDAVDMFRLDNESFASRGE